MSVGDNIPVASTRAITLNLISMGLGTGLLTMPWGVAGASIVNSLVLLAIVLALNFWAINVIVRACEEWQEFDLGGLLCRLPGKLGPRLQTVTNMIVWFSQLFVLIGYTLVIRDSAYDLLPEQSFLRHKWLLTVLTACFVLPLSFLDQAYLAFTSTLGILANTYLIMLLVAYTILPEMLQGSKHRDTSEPLCLFGMGTNSFSGIVCMFSLLMYTIIIQMAIPPMYQELEDRSPQRFRRCLLVAFICLFVIFAAVMICGYVAWGSAVESNILDAFPKDLWGNAARFGMLLCILGCYPLNVKPMVAPFSREAAGAADANSPLLEGGETTSPSLLLPTCLVVVVTTLCSLFVTNLGSLNAINGAAQVIAYIGLVPGISGLYLLSKVGPGERIALWLVICFATAMAAIGVIATENNVIGMIADCSLTVSIS